MQSPFIEVSEKYRGRVDILKINADESPEVLKELGIMSIPTLVGFAKGEEILRRSGVQTTGMLDFFFSTTMNQTKPAIMPPAPATRIFRTAIGIIVFVLGWYLWNSPWLMALGGLVVFSAFYDRCPILKAIAPKIKYLFNRTAKI
jgi:thioredoxin 1